jgi:outer membrane protein assembly factor BamB
MRALLYFIVFVLTLPLCAQEWTRFRGPNGSGLSEAKTLPSVWSDHNFKWKTTLPGAGHSSPVIWGDKVFVTSCDETAGKFYVFACDTAVGTQLWQKEFPLTPYRKHAYNTLASGTPAVDAERVYVPCTDNAHTYLIALDHQGGKIWQRDFGPFRSQHGSGASPIVYEGKVIFPNEQDGESSLVAVAAATGEILWRVPRNVASSSAAYSTPCVYQPSNTPAALIFNSEVHGISALAPDTGKLLWEFPDAFDKRSVSSPVIAGNLILGSCGSGGGGNFVVAVRPPATADAKPERAYEVRKSAPYVPTSISLGDWLYLWSDAGIVSRVRAATGEIQWQERVGGNYFGSPVCVDNRLFCVSTTGEVVVVAAGEKFEVLARNPLNDKTHSTPAVAGGQMFIHTSGSLICIGGAPTAGPAASP